MKLKIEVISLKKIVVQYKFPLIVIGILVVAFYLFVQSNDEINDSNEFSNSLVEKDSEKSQEENGTNNEITRMVVDVKGEVMNPGIYEASTDERIQDLITRAGGFRKKADQSKVNLAQKIKDEMVIYVPKIGDKTSDISINPTSDSSNDTGKVNINNATSEQLQTISGIGPSKAAAIIEYREKQGLFKGIEDIKNVTGIGDKTFEKLKDSITVD
ncbi:helix-hairpin-helix domain-containing protein [Heyndrickxia vini]|uniref:Helix-hairpin-helix domain-containing protein n=1 Tax=Heyndrickxia vini TaxID=1476025 RepID=A0ABX7E4Z1_9BACI|nr:helix-hairpin-helix domain-containing protein [Heyndrickxia vini]QQZ10801.1 helix-hairpin-helix domain-containing protein [Heyndrickxia vini]